MSYLVTIYLVSSTRQYYETFFLFALYLSIRALMVFLESLETLISLTGCPWGARTLVVIVVLSYYSYLAVAHAELLINVFTE